MSSSFTTLLHAMLQDVLQSLHYSCATDRC